MSSRAQTLTPEQIGRLTRRGLRLAQFTIAYNAAEGAVAVTAGVIAGLISVVGFGFDSAIESMSAVLVALRLSARLRNGVADERKERIALRLVAASFYILAGYVTIEGIRSLIVGGKPESSPVALGLLAFSLIVMPVLAAAKKRVGAALNDNLILADAAQTKICVLLSISTLLGVGLFQLTGAAWLDPAAGFIIAVFAIHEGREAWAGELVGDDWRRTLSAPDRTRSAVPRGGTGDDTLPPVTDVEARTAHWDDRYRTAGADRVSWFEAQPHQSLALLQMVAAGPSSSVIDIGGGASLLAQCLVEQGYHDVSVLDISAEALDVAKKRLPRPDAVTWIKADLLEWVPDRHWQVWHDRALFHFLTEQRARAAYRALLHRAIAPGGAAIIATFDEDGPTSCSGLPVARYSPTQLIAEMGPGFTPIGCGGFEHVTPTGLTQKFTWVALRADRP